MTRRATLSQLGGLFVFVISLASAWRVTASPAVDGSGSSEVGSPRWRRPTSLWLSPDHEFLLAGGSKSGTISVIDTQKRHVVGEYPVGKSVVALAGTPDGRTLAAVDKLANELILMDRHGSRLEVRSRVGLPAQPTNLLLSPDGTYWLVPSRWARLITRVDQASGQRVGEISLDFSPHGVIVLPGGKTLLVADAFGGQLALVDLETEQVVRRTSVPGHNLRGFALTPSGKELLVTQMLITESAATTRDNVFWGIAMTSNVRVIPVAALRDVEKNPVREAHTHFFGDPNNGAGDPEAMEILSDGTAIVCLAGVGEVAVGRYYPYGFLRITVGKRPSALAINAADNIAYVANAHSDSISIVDIQRRSVVTTIALWEEPQLSLAEEGERSFFDARLSLDGWFSCHSCHTDGHTNGYKADTFGDGSYGAPKTILSLLGTRDSEPWAWNGSKRQLEDQVRESLRMTMQPKAPASEGTVAALAAYLRSLEPPPVAAWQSRDKSAIARGQQIFQSRDCGNCHAPPIYTDQLTHDVGLNDGEGGNRQFSPPSLRGIAHLDSFFHDGRARSLEEVLGRYQHRLRTALSEDELNDLVAFLKSL